MERFRFTNNFIFNQIFFGQFQASDNNLPPTATFYNVRIEVSIDSCRHQIKPILLNYMQIVKFWLQYTTKVRHTQISFCYYPWKKWLEYIGKITTFQHLIDIRHIFLSIIANTK